jgi:hypothetical protein
MRRIRFSLENPRPPDPAAKYEAIELKVRLAHCVTEAQRLAILGVPSNRRVRMYDTLTKYDLAAINVRWAACSTKEHRDRFKKDYPAISAWSNKRISDLLTLDKALENGRTLPEQKAATRRRIRH